MIKPCKGTTNRESIAFFSVNVLKIAGKPHYPPDLLNNPVM